MASSIKNVVIVGASGALGSSILERLVLSGNFNITKLVRTGSSTASPFPGVRVVEADFESQDSLRAALTSQDAVVSALGNLAVGAQIPLVEAAAATGVKRFIPSDFGGDFKNPKTRGIPVFAQKVQVQEAAINASSTSDMTYTFIYCGALINWGLQNDFILRTSDYKPVLVDGGDALFSATYESTVGDAVVSVLSQPEKTRNRTIYIHDLWLSQKKLLGLAKEAAPNKAWDPSVVSLTEMIADASSKLAAGDFSMDVVMAFVTQVIMDPSCGGKFEKVDNEVLGIGSATEADVLKTLKKVIK